jgi:hypothetical protein
MTLSFSQGDAPTTVPLRTKAHGEVYFYLGQLLRAVQDDGKGYRLITCAYWYRLQSKAALNAEAAIRWEYERELDQGKSHCRHHIQQKARVDLGTHPLDLNRAHVPTAYVTLEEIIRFFIVDLGVKPLASDWESKLEASERKFYEEFSGKRYTAPRRRGGKPAVR